MQGMSEIIERLKDVLARELGEKRVLDKDVASALGVAPVTLASMKKRGSIPFEAIASFCARRAISLNWLLFNQAPESLVESTNRFMSVRYFRDVAASAGGGAFESDEGCETLPIGEELAGVMGLECGEIEAIHVTGDSMEPTLGDGDLLFIDRQKTQPAKGGIFVIATPHGLFVKRLQNRLDGQVDVISDNPSYPLQTLPAEEITVVGRAVHALKGL